MICLHGSGSDDTSVFGSRLYIRLAEESGFIMAAPFARGESHCYCPQESLNDIVELTAVLKRIFNITDQPVILQGFSMGGYGVLRVYDYCSHIFDGIAMFSGHPDLPPEFGISDQPDYMKDENIEKFKNANMIIYHGSQDLNCSFEEMNKFIDKLKGINQKLQVVISDCGHSGIREEWYESFKNGLYLYSMQVDFIAKMLHYIILPEVKNLKRTGLNGSCCFNWIQSQLMILSLCSETAAEFIIS